MPLLAPALGRAPLAKSPKRFLGPWHHRRPEKFRVGAGTGKVVQLQRDQANIVGKILRAGKLLNFLNELLAEFLAPKVDALTHALQQAPLDQKTVSYFR